MLVFTKKALPLQSQTQKFIQTFGRVSSIGAIAQLVEQRTENPCVPGSIPGGTTRKRKKIVKLHHRLDDFFIA